VHHRLEPGKNLICHHCSHKQVMPETCPACKSPAPLRQGGAGTQKIFQLLGELFPAARVLRMDSDVISEEDGAGDEIVRRFRKREADILVGTRLVSKGFHFPDVTLVGVIDGDTPLNMPDFRAAERTFTLLFQAGGRAGRGDKAGLVIIQTSQPDHYTMHALMARDFRAFAETELEFRKELEYPPFGHLAHVVFHGTNKELVEKTAEDAATRLSADPVLQGMEVLGPAPCVYGRLKGRFRYQLLLKAEDWKRFRGAFDALAAMDLPPSVRWGLNVDPSDVM
jgi:primosomal protein N' (replication factor Y)